MADKKITDLAALAGADLAAADVVPVVDPQREVAEVHRLVHMRDARRGRHGATSASARARKTREI